MKATSVNSLIAFLTNNNLVLLSPKSEFKNVWSIIKLKCNICGFEDESDFNTLKWSGKSELVKCKNCRKEYKSEIEQLTICFKFLYFSEKLGFDFTDSSIPEVIYSVHDRFSLKCKTCGIEKKRKPNKVFD